MDKPTHLITFAQPRYVGQMPVMSVLASRVNALNWLAGATCIQLEEGDTATELAV